MDNNLIPLARTEESKVLDYKVKGDYYRYLAECATGDAVNNATGVACAEYTNRAEKDLVVTHPIRVSLTLNFSVFRHEVLQNLDEACKMACAAFEDAITDLSSVYRKGVNTRTARYWSASTRRALTLQMACTFARMTLMSELMTKVSCSSTRLMRLRTGCFSRV